MTFNYDYNSVWFKSPGYLKCKIPECVIEEIKKTLDDIKNELVDVVDFREKLAGHLEKETSLPITPNIKYLVETMGLEYDKVFRDGKPDTKHIHEEQIIGKELQYELKTLWINYGKKYDFNPIHYHFGTYSFVIWINIPYKIEDEMKKYNPNTNKTSTFNFVYTLPSGEISSEEIETKEWSMIFFPSKLNHCVYPFYSSDEYRISISGNLFLTFK